MTPKVICLSILLALFAALASKDFMTPHIPFFEHLIVDNLYLPTFSSLPSIIPSMLIPNLHRHSHHRHHKDEKKAIKAICDDFPPDFPPPDTNTTSVFCVDSNGCCNFTTVQAAVDAVGVMSMKRTVIWINNGIYL